MPPLSISQKALQQQGYRSLSREELDEVSNGLRFTPFALAIVAGIGYFQPLHFWYFALAVINIAGFWLPKFHPFDVLYNGLISKIFNLPRVPVTPLPRRIAWVTIGMINIGIGSSIMLGELFFARILIVTLSSVLLMVVSSHFCPISWSFEQITQYLGIADKPISTKKAKQLITDGAQLVDVRSPQEFAKKHLTGSINIPFDKIASVDSLKNQAIIVCCESGTLAPKAKTVLSQRGDISAIYSFGSINRWE